LLATKNHHQEVQEQH